MVRDGRVREWNSFPDRDGSLCKALDLAIGCFNEECAHSSWLQRDSSTLRPVSSLDVPSLPRLVKGHARRYEVVLADGAVDISEDSLMDLP